MDQDSDRDSLPHQLDGGLGARARIGLIVLATDQNIEHEWRLISRGVDGVALHQTRIWNEARITPDTLRAMEGRLADSAAVIIPGLPLACLAFGCTSATMMIGEEGVFARLCQARPQGQADHPDHRGLRGVPRVRGKATRGAHALPCRRECHRARLHRGPRLRGPGVRHLRRGGRPPRRLHRHGLDPRVAIEHCRDPRVAAVFVACTSLRVAEAVAEIEAATGKPATSSNHAMVWHALRLAGVEEQLPGGRLFAS